MVLNVVIWIVKSLSIVVTFWNDKSVENYLNLCTLDVMILIYRFKMIVILIYELVCD